MKDRATWGPVAPSELADNDEDFAVRQFLRDQLDESRTFVHKLVEFNRAARDDEKLFTALVEHHQ